MKSGLDIVHEWEEKIVQIRRQGCSFPPRLTLKENEMRRGQCFQESNQSFFGYDTNQDASYVIRAYSVPLSASVSACQYLIRGLGIDTSRINVPLSVQGRCQRENNNDARLRGRCLVISLKGKHASPGASWTFEQLKRTDSDILTIRVKEFLRKYPFIDRNCCRMKLDFLSQILWTRASEIRRI